METSLPVGKLPPELLSQLIQSAPTTGKRVVLGPGIGLDCAVLDLGETYLVFKSEPITFATDEIGWYSVQIAANDIATTGAVPRWMLITLLLPEGKTTPELVAEIGRQLFDTCRQMGILVIGGHTEITYGLDRPIANTTMIGEVSPEHLVTPQNARPGDRVLLTKGVPIEGTAIIARELASRLADAFSSEEIKTAQDFLYEPGISVVRDAAIAISAGKVSAMHDPTEGGIANALWELAVASSSSLHVDLDAIPVPGLSARLCRHFSLDPLGTIASGALLLTAPPEEAEKILAAYRQAGVACADIGQVESGPARVWYGKTTSPKELPQPRRDEIGKIFESPSS
ncbi:MAG TPA: AIR synthase [Chloroflexi bacterium]|nr:AIR synthase [Chloroflexota bacterium]HPO58374.1 AIR synthase family protein [Anaerolineaceae bacterium]